MQTDKSTGWGGYIVFIVVAVGLLVTLLCGGLMTAAVIRTQPTATLRPTPTREGTIPAFATANQMLTQAADAHATAEGYATEAVWALTDNRPDKIFAAVTLAAAAMNTEKALIDAARTKIAAGS